MLKVFDVSVALKLAAAFCYYCVFISVDCLSEIVAWNVTGNTVDALNVRCTRQNDPGAWLLMPS